MRRAVVVAATLFFGGLACADERPGTPSRLEMGVVDYVASWAMRLGKPPAGSGHWTLQLLADELVALEIVESISYETVRKVLKKNGMTKRKIEFSSIRSIGQKTDQSPPKKQTKWHALVCFRVSSKALNYLVFFDLKRFAGDKIRECMGIEPTDGFLQAAHWF